MQLVAAVVHRSDSYVELPWKAFALGASLAAFCIVSADVLQPQWTTAESALLHAVIILGVGAACALSAVFAPPFARLFLREVRRHVEVKQAAQALFLTRELFKTRERCAVLIFVSQFERRIEILADVGLRDRISESDWCAVVDAMTPHLRERRPFHALQDGIAAAERILLAKGCRAKLDTVDELPNRPIEERE